MHCSRVVKMVDEVTSRNENSTQNAGRGTVHATQSGRAWA